MRSDEEEFVHELAGDDEDRVARKRREKLARDAVLAAEPTTVAARCLLRKALGTRFETMADRPQALMLVVSDASWSGPVRDAWRLHFKGGAWDESLGHATPGSAGEHGWFCIRQAARSSVLSSKPGICVEEVGRALSAGGELLLLVHDLAGVPPPVRAAMDRLVEVPPMDWPVLRHVAEGLYGPMKGKVRMDDGPVAAVGPSALRLAVRRGNTAMGYAERAIRIASEADARPVPKTKLGPTGLARVPGMGPCLDWGRSLAADLAAYRRGDLPWSAVDRGALLVGPPGVGKTTFAAALAEECDVPLVGASYAAWQSNGHQGDMLKAMRKSFAEAREQAPAILFIDELDSFPNRVKASQEHGAYLRGVVNGLLAELDGAQGREGVVVIGATNDASIIDPAITRAGRLDRTITVGLPCVRGRADILRVHLGAELPGEDLWQVARIGEGISGADLEKAVREARRAARAAKREVMVGDLVMAVAEARGLNLVPTSVFQAH